MTRIHPLPVLLLTVASLAAGQTARPVPSSVDPSAHARTVPPSATLIPPWSQANATQIEFRAPEQMTAGDRTLAGATQIAIAARAEIAGFDLKNGSWSYRQIFCPALPNHLFLRYTRDQGAGDVSVFSASIARVASGSVHIIPILRRSFTPPSVSSATIAIFNRIGEEEHSDQPPALLGVSLCYAALAGATGALSASSAIIERGATVDVVNFTDAAAAPRTMEWSLTFDAKGRLLKARHDRAASLDARPVPAGTAPKEVHIAPPADSSAAPASSPR